jgi:hypothetical protein
MFRFTIRDVLLLTVIVALGVGWCIDRSRLASLYKSSQTEVVRQREFVNGARKMVDDYFPGYPNATFVPGYPEVESHANQPAPDSP